MFLYNIYHVGRFSIYAWHVIQDVWYLVQEVGSEDRFKEMIAQQGAVNYYAVLDVPFNASNADIRKGYHNAARIHHPDKNRGANKEEAEERFKRIQEAYEVLKDEETRRMYNLYGQILRSGPPPPQPSQTRRDTEADNPATMSSHKVLVTLEDLHAGCVKKFKLTRNVYDSGGSIVGENVKIVHLYVPRGTMSGFTVIEPDCGDIYPNGQGSASVAFIVTAKKHAIYELEDPIAGDLRIAVDVPLAQCRSAGWETTLPVIGSSQPYTLRVEPPISPGQVVNVPKMGLYSSTNGKRGKLKVELRPM